MPSGGTPIVAPAPSLPDCSRRRALPRHAAGEASPRGVWTSVGAGPGVALSAAGAEGEGDATPRRDERELNAARSRSRRRLQVPVEGLRAPPSKKKLQSSDESSTPSLRRAARTVWPGVLHRLGADRQGSRHCSASNPSGGPELPGSAHRRFRGPAAASLRRLHGNMCVHQAVVAASRRTSSGAILA